MTRTLVVAGWLAVLAGCGTRQHVQAAQSEYAVPARNPVARGTVAEPLEQRAVDAVSTRAAVFDAQFASIGWAWRDVLRPALSPAGAVELQDAYRECVWAPGLGPHGEPGQATVTFGIKRREPAPPGR